jgi:hypothetical protein
MSGATLRLPQSQKHYHASEGKDRPESDRPRGAFLRRE